MTASSLWELRQTVEIAVPWSAETLLIVPGCASARKLRAKIGRPGRVWCVCEALDLLLTGVNREDARRIAEARLTVDGMAIRIAREGH